MCNCKYAYLKHTHTHTSQTMQSPVKEIFESCFQADPSARPSFEEIYTALEIYEIDIEDEDLGV